jgi:hypothetical protein
MIHKALTGSFALSVMTSALLAVGGLAVAGQLPAINGDVDCSGSAGSVDALKILRFDAGLPNNQPTNCAPIGGEVPTPGVGLARDNPVPMGQEYLVPEGWRVRMVDFIPDATQMVLDENQFNDPPRAGYKFAIVRVRVTNVSAEEPADPDVSFAMRMVGSLNVGYSTFENSCGVIPDDFPSNDVFRGGSAEGNICFEVGETETNFSVYTEYFLSDDENVRWFEVE